MSITTDPTQIFIRNWEIYQKIILEDYMNHKKLGKLSQAYLLEFANQSPIKMLDIGCGDAHQIANQLASLNTLSYTGYDLSEQAIALAKQHIQKTKASPKFHIGKMEELIKVDTNTYNLLYSSFAIHHLTDENKISFIADCFSRLENKGIFILIDIKRLPGQSTSDYKKSYADWIYQEWDALEQDEKDAIVQHLQTCDIPVETTSYIRFAQEAGFKFIEEADVDPRHTLLVFSKN